MVEAAAEALLTKRKARQPCRIVFNGARRTCSAVGPSPTDSRNYFMVEMRSCGISRSPPSCRKKLRLLFFPPHPGCQHFCCPVALSAPHLHKRSTNLPPAADYSPKSPAPPPQQPGCQPRWRVSLAPDRPLNLGSCNQSSLFLGVEHPQPQPRACAQPR